MNLRPLLPALCVALFHQGYAQSEHEYENAKPAEVLAFSVPAQPPTAQRSGSLHDTALILGAYSVAADSPLAGFASSQAASNYRAELGKEWDQFEAQTLGKARGWAQQTLAPVAGNLATVYYPFSGPDILHVATFYPSARTYVLCGLEPVGPAPDLSRLNADQAVRALNETRNALRSVIRFSFFLTKEMKVDFDTAVLRGVMPILFAFLARTGHQIIEVDFVNLEKDGALSPAPEGKSNGVKISCQAPDGGSRTFYYFTTDISDSGVAKSGFLQFMASQGDGAGYVKAASYLMHNAYFSKIRNQLLAQCAVILQDDSGVPIKYFDPNVWNVQLWGNYTAPIDLFKDRMQPDLRAAYQARSQPLSLGFGVGYRWRKNDSNMQLAIKK